MHDPTFDDLVRQFAGGPVADGPTRLLGQLAGDRDDADDLLGAEGGRHPWARDVVEDLLDEGRQLLVAEQAALRLLEFGGGL